MSAAAPGTGGTEGEESAAKHDLLSMTRLADMARQMHACPDCRGYMRVSRQRIAEGAFVTRLTTFHDDTCPALAGVVRR